MRFTAHDLYFSVQKCGRHPEVKFELMTRLLWSQIYVQALWWMKASQTELQPRLTWIVPTPVRKAGCKLLSITASGSISEQRDEGASRATAHSFLPCSLCHDIPNAPSYFGSRVSSGSIVSDYGLEDRAIGVRFPAGAKDFSSIICVQTGSAAHPDSCTMGTGGPFSGGKSAAGAWRWPLTPI
jgi:hypothetical protein